MLRAAVCIGVALLVVVASGDATTRAGVATAREPASPRQGPPAFTPGSGSGQGRLLGVQLRSSGVSVGVVAGRASARFQGAQGNAESSVLDPGLLGTLANTPLVCGRPISDLVPIDQLPQPLKVSSGGGEASERQTVGGDANAPIRFGTQTASAAPNSRAEAGVRGLTLGIPGVVTIRGGEASSRAELTSGQRAGSGHARVGAIELGGGVVRLGNLTWTAEHRTGSETAADATFTIGSLRVAGLDVPVGSPQQLRAGLDLANTVLGTLGLEIAAPEPTSSEDRAEAPPLRLTLAPTSLLLTTLAPLTEQIQPLRSALLDLLEPFALGDECSVESVAGFSYLIVDLVVAAMGSGGGVDLLVGGARAGTDDTAFVNPFGSGHAPPPSPPPSTTTTTITPTTTTPTATTAPATTEAPAPPSTEIAAAPAVASETVCSSTHPVSQAGCSSGAAVLAGALALGVVGTLAGVDRYRTRQARGGPTR